MEFPPEEWDVFPGEDINSAAPRAAGTLNMELLVQARPRRCAQLPGGGRLAVPHADLAEGR
jgi:hypothetical protein